MERDEFMRAEEKGAGRRERRRRRRRCDSRHGVVCDVITARVVGHFCRRYAASGGSGKLASIMYFPGATILTRLNVVPSARAPKASSTRRAPSSRRLRQVTQRREPTPRLKSRVA